MNNSRNVLTWFLVFVFALTTVSAVEDFTATGTARILGFACSPAQGELIITNTGDVVSVYELIPEGKAKDWVLYVPDTFSLQPGQTQTVQQYFSIPCDAEDQFLDTAILTTELELILTQDILVQTPNNIVIEPVVYEQEILACDTADFSFVLKNPAEFTETYSLKVVDSPKETLLTAEKLSLPPQGEETIGITVRPEDCTLSGDFNPYLSINTEKSRLAAEIDMFLTIKDTHIPKIAEGIDSIRAGFEPQEASFDITNTGNEATVYLLRIDGPSWITVQPTLLAVDELDTEQVKLIMQPPEGTAAGSHEIKIIAEVEETGTEYEKDFTIKLGPPTFFELLYTTYLPYAIAGIVILVILIILIVWGVRKHNTPEAKARRAEKRAEREQKRKEQLALKEQKRREKEEAREQKKQDNEKEKERAAKEEERRAREIERERVKAQRAHEKQLRKEHLMIPKDSIIDGIKETGKRWWKLALLVLIVALVILGIVFQNAVAENSDAVLTGIIVLLVILILHRIRRRRIVRKKWKLALANSWNDLNTRWRKGVTQVSFKLNNVINKLVVTVKRAKPTITAPGKLYQAFIIVPNVEHSNIDEARITFKIKKSWMMKNRIMPSSVRLLKLENNRWQSIVAEPVSTDDKYVSFVAETDGLGEFAIVGKPGKQLAKARKISTSKISWRWIGLGIFFLVAIVGIIALDRLIPSPAPTVGIPAQVWKQDTQHTLDLGQYFKDPDNDVLTFTATRTDNIDISIVGDKALLTPSYGWSGRERAVFMADDGKGGLVKSNPVELVVESTIIPKSYAKPILTISIIVLLVLAVILFRRTLKKLVGLE